MLKIKFIYFITQLQLQITHTAPSSGSKNCFLKRKRKESNMLSKSIVHVLQQYNRGDSLLWVSISLISAHYYINTKTH